MASISPMAKRKVIGAKGKGFLGDGSGGSVQSDIRGEGDSKKREMSIQCSFCCLDTINA